MNTKKLVLSILVPILVAILVASAVPTIVFAAQGTVGLVAWKSPTDYLVASNNISVMAGKDDVSKLDGAGAAGYKLALNLSSVTFSGGQFDIYISKDGYSSLSSGDKLVVSGLRVSDLYSASNKTVTVKSDLYPDGEVTVTFLGGNKSIIMPAPFYVPGGSYYIKIYDGSTTAVAVSAAKLIILPSIKVSPTSGPTGTTVTVEGAAWVPGGEGGRVNVTVLTAANVARFTKLVSPDSNGQFKITFTAPDENKKNGDTAANSDHVLTVKAWNVTESVPNGYNTNYSAQAAFTVKGRAFKYLETKKPDGSSLDSVAGVGSYDSGAVTLNAMVGGEVYVNGTNFNVAGQIKVYWDYNESSSFEVTPEKVFLNTTSGYFCVKFKVPETVRGTHLVAIHDGSWSWNFTLNVLTSLIVEPSEPKPGATVTIKGYAFDYPAKVNLTFYGTKIDGNNETVLLAKNVETDSMGRFVVTAKVPDVAYGGTHYILAYNDTKGNFTAITVEVKPKIEVAKTMVAQGGVVEVNVWGWPVGTESININGGANQTQGATAKLLTLAWDNGVTAIYKLNVSDVNKTGTITLKVVAVGVPGLHYVTLYDGSGEIVAGPVAVNVTGSTTEGSKLSEDLAALSAKVESLSQSVSDISSMVDELSGKVSDLSGSVGDVRSAVTTLKSTIGDLKSAVASLSATVDTLKSTVSDLGSTVSSVSGKVDSVSGKVDAVSKSVSDLSGRLSALDSKVSGLSSDLAAVKQQAAQIGNLSNLVLVAIVVAIIVLVLEIVVLIRR